MEFFKDKKVFVTGSGGFIGSQLSERLLELGANVTCFLRYTSSNNIGNLKHLPKDLIERAKIEYGDIRDYERIKYLIEGQEIVFHLSSSISIPYSYMGIRDVVSTNIDGTLNVLTASKEADIDKLIHTSTSEVYGSGQYFPIDEKHPLCAQSPYSASKIAADKLVESFEKSYDLPVVVVRPFNTYGPRQSARAIIPTIITQAVIREKIYLGSLHPKRDFTYVSDTVNGFLISAESSTSSGQVFNIGSGIDVSIGDLCKIILNILGLEREILSCEERIRPDNSEVSRLQADYSKAKNFLGYTPKVNLEVGIQRTIDFLEKNIFNYKADVYRF